MSRENTPSDASVLAGAIAEALADLQFCMPGRVEAYDPTQQRANVQPLLQRPYRDEAGDRRAEDYPVVPEVPVAFFSAGPFSQTCPIAVGVTGMLFFASGSLDRWLAGKGGVVDPGDERRGALSDAVFYPGLRPFGAPLPAEALHPTAAVLRGPLLHIGGDQELALKSDLDALIAAFNAHIHQAQGPVSPTTPPVAPGSAVLLTAADSVSPGVPPFDTHGPAAPSSLGMSVGTTVLKGG